MGYDDRDTLNNRAKNVVKVVNLFGIAARDATKVMEDFNKGMLRLGDKQRLVKKMNRRLWKKGK